MKQSFLFYPCMLCYVHFDKNDHDGDPYHIGLTCCWKVFLHVVNSAIFKDFFFSSTDIFSWLINSQWTRIRNQSCFYEELENKFRHSMGQLECQRNFGRPVRDKWWMLSKKWFCEAMKYFIVLEFMSDLSPSGTCIGPITVYHWPKHSKHAQMTSCIICI